MRCSRKLILALLPLVVGCADADGPGARAHREALARDPEAAVVTEVAVVGAPQVDGIGEERSSARPDDLDRDGVPAESDLDDFDELVGAELYEIPCDGSDQDGDLADVCLVDVDGDGVPGDYDCDDLDADVSPDAREIRCNGEDENCNGVDDCDQDGDGLRDVDDPAPRDPDVTSLAEPSPPRWP